MLKDQKPSSLNIEPYLPPQRLGQGAISTARRISPISPLPCVPYDIYTK